MPSKHRADSPTISAKDGSPDKSINDKLRLQGFCNTPSSIQTIIDSPAFSFDYRVFPVGRASQKSAPDFPSYHRSLLHIIMMFLHVSPQLFAWWRIRAANLVAETSRTPPNAQEATFRTRSTVSLMKAVLIFQHGNGSPPRSPSPENSRGSPGNFRRRQKNPPLLRHAVRSNGSALLRPHEKRAPAKRTGALPLFVLAASPQTYHLSSTKVCPRRKCACKEARHVPPNRRSREAETRGRGGLVPTLSGNYSPPHAFPVFSACSAFRTSSLCRR